MPNGKYGLSGEDVDELALLDNDYARRIEDARGPSNFRTGNSVGCALGAVLLFALLLAAAFGVSTALEFQSPVFKATAVDGGAHRRELEAARERRNAAELRAHRTDRAAAGSAPITEPTSTAFPYCCTGGLGVMPPEYITVATPTAQTWQGNGGARR